MASPVRKMRTDAIGKRLCAIRNRCGVTGEELATRLECRQSRVSKIEVGALKPSSEYIQEFGAALKLPSTEIRELEFVTKVFLVEFDRWHLYMKGSGKSVRELTTEMEIHISLVRKMDWSTLPDLLQTAMYAEGFYASIHGFSLSEARARVKELMGRQQRLLSAPREFSFVLAEHVFYTTFCSREVSFEQIDALHKISNQENVTLHILPMCCSLPIVPTTSFCVLDELLATVDTSDFLIPVLDIERIQRYIQDFDSLKNCSTQSKSETQKALERIRRRIKDN